MDSHGDGRKTTILFRTALIGDMLSYKEVITFEQQTAFLSKSKWQLYVRHRRSNTIDAESQPFTSLRFL